MPSYSQRRAQGSHIWDPASIFSVINPARGSQTCIGIAHSKGRRCEIGIAAANRDAIKRKIDRLAQSMPSFSRMEEDLYEIAELCLCQRWHQDQVDDVVVKWKSLVREEKRRLRRRENPSGNTTSSREASAPQLADLMDMISTLRSQLSRCEAQLARVSSSQGSATSSTDRNDEGEAHVVRQVVSLSNHNVQQTPASRDGSSFSGVLVSSSHAAAPISLGPAAGAPTITSHSDVSNPDIAYGPTSTDATSRGRRSPQECAETHVQRRSTDEECVVCTELCTNCPLPELVWCKRTCGRNMHKSCFSEWREFRAIDGRTACCPICRSTWQLECSHDEEEPHFGIWTEEALGLDVLFSLAVL